MISFPDFTFTHPYLLLLLELVPIMLIFYFRNYRRQRSIIQISSFSGFQNYRKTFRQKLIHLPFILRLSGVSCLIIAMADPKTVRYDLARDPSPTESVILIDISQNVLARDFLPSRFSTLKTALDHFLDTHIGQSYGIVTMGSNVITRVPITDDIQTLKRSLENLAPEFSGAPNLQQGIETSLLNFEGSVTQHKQILLFLAGNPSIMHPYYSQIPLCKKMGVSIYPLIIASEGIIPYPMVRNGNQFYTNQIIDIHEKPLIGIALLTKGFLFRARNNAELDQNFLKLSDVLERVKTKKNPSYSGILPFAWMAAIFWLLEILAKYTFLKSLP